MSIESCDATVGIARDRMCGVLDILRACNNLTVELVGREPEEDNCKLGQETEGNIGELLLQIERARELAVEIREQLARIRDRI